MLLVVLEMHDVGDAMARGERRDRAAHVLARRPAGEHRARRFELAVKSDHRFGVVGEIVEGEELEGGRAEMIGVGNAAGGADRNRVARCPARPLAKPAI